MARFDFEGAYTVLMSTEPGILKELATQVRTFATEAHRSGQSLTDVADTVAARHPELDETGPYTAFYKKLGPVGDRLSGFGPPSTAMAGKLDEAADRASAGHKIATMWRARLDSAVHRAKQSGTAASGSGLPSAIAEQVLQRVLDEGAADMNAKIDDITAVFNSVSPGTAASPAGLSASGGSGAAGASGASGESDDTGGSGAADVAAPMDGGTPDTLGAGSGPATGEYAGWVKDPSTGNLVDPSTGREVDPSGRFLDPVTGQPFGDAAQYASRLEGLSASLGGAGGSVSLGPLGGGGVGGAGGFAGLYGGMVPPSLVGANPASAELRRTAVQNLASKADVAQRYAAAVNGEQNQQNRGYMPPMGGVGGGMPAASATRGGRRLVSESAGVWGATGRGRRNSDEQARDAATTTEDVDVWGADAPPVGLLDGR